MASERDEPTQTTDKGLEIPIPTRADWDKTLGKVVKPKAGDSATDITLDEDELAREQAADDGWPDPSQQPE